MSVRLSVRLSVSLSACPSSGTRQHCMKAAEGRIMEITPHNSPGTLVFGCQMSRLNSNGVNHPLSALSICCDPWHHPCSIYVPDSLFAPPSVQVLFDYLLVWHPSLRTPYISSPNRCLLFATHAHTIATCFAAVPRLYLLIPSLSQPFTWNSTLTPHIHLTILISAR